MNAFFSTLLTFFEAYGYPALWMVVFIAAAGAPLPINLLLGTAGAFAALGDFNIFWLAGVTICASVCGDNCGYLIGRIWGSQALAWLARSSIGKRIFRPNTLSAAYTYFKRYGGWGVFLSRFLFSFFGGFVNLLAGSQRFSYRTFLICDIAGEMVGAALSLALGWVFGASWEAAGGILNMFSLFLLGFLIVVLLLSRLLRRGKQRAQDVCCTPSNSPNSEETSPSFLAASSASTESHRCAVAAREPQGDEHLWRKPIRKLNYLFLLHFRPEQPHAGRD